MQCVILAGGLATRLRPVTEKIPKSMIRIGDKPFLEYQLGVARKGGVSDIVLCVGHLSVQIKDYFGDGGKFGVNISYSDEGEELLGTLGAIRKAMDMLEDAFLVLYGDSYLDIDYKSVYEYFLTSNHPALLVVYKNTNKWDKSNAIFRNGAIEVYDKEHPVSEMKYIDYGLSVLSKKLIEELPDDIPLDLAGLYRDLAHRKKLAGYEARKRFHEVGSKNGLKEFEELVMKKEIML